MNNKTLVVLAAGIGSRFGGGVKQLEPVGPTDELIIDYSIHDAIEAGFNKIVFIIRHDIEADFRNRIGNRIESVCNKLGVTVCYAFQEQNMFVDSVPEGRTKPWGTGHAVLCAADQIDSSFAVINSDDYYGKEGFRKASAFLPKNEFGLIGYILKNTLSDNGGVTRGVCTVDNGRLVGINETHNIVKTSSGAEVDGKPLDINSLVSMNFWCYPLAFIDVLKSGFPNFINSLKDSLKDEYLLPIIADSMLKTGTTFSVIPTDDKWFGVTYKEDKDTVIKSIRSLYETGVYKTDLYSDLLDTKD